jgi:hypothetical protein
MQDVPPKGEKIKAGFRIVGYVIGIRKRDPAGSGILVRFESIQDGKRTIPLDFAVLAVASAAGVHGVRYP